MSIEKVKPDDDEIDITSETGPFSTSLNTLCAIR